VRRLAVILFSFAALAGAPSASAAAVPCWKQVINDWLGDGRIDRIYADSCYAEALDQMPDDLEGYSSLADDIALARTFAQREQLPPPGEDGRRGEVVPPSGGGGTNGRNDHGFVRSFLVRIGPKNADEVPIPLLVLGSLAVLLMASGAAGVVARRTAHRRIPLGPPLGGS
jgi:hypothetical protein